MEIKVHKVSKGLMGEIDFSSCYFVQFAYERRRILYKKLLTW